jgi:hypothetical protein
MELKSLHWQFVEEYGARPMFVFSICIQLLMLEDGVSVSRRGSFKECQSVSHHWTITKHNPNGDEPMIMETHGNGATGHYPEFFNGCGYANCQVAGVGHAQTGWHFNLSPNNKAWS